MYRRALWGFVAIIVIFFGLTRIQAATTNVVQVRNFYFIPTNLFINVGDSVLWTNLSGTPHDVTQGTRAEGATPNPYWAPANLVGFTGRFFLSFSNVGFYPYICAQHVSVPGAIGPQQTGTVTVAIANFAPTVAITTPSNLSRFTAPGSFLLSADATDSDGTITNVQFFAGANSLGADTVAPFSIDVSGLSSGAYQLTARASDDLGGVSTSAVVHVFVNTNHTVTVSGISFVPNALSVTVGDTVTFTGLNGLHTVTGTNASLLQEPFCGDAFPPTCTVTFNTVGFFGYRCNPHGQAGMVGSITVNGPNLRPNATLTSPANGTVFGAPATISLAAVASDFAGAVASVRFVRGGTQSLGLDTISPYTATASSLTVGNHVLTALVTDNTGLVNTSAPVNISIINASPIELRSPVSLPAGFKFDFTANTGMTYVVEGSVATGSPAPFTPIATNVATNSIMSFTDPAGATRSNRAYRVFRPQ